MEAHAVLLNTLTAAAAAFCGADTSEVTFSTCDRDDSVPCGEEQSWYCLSVCSGGFSAVPGCAALPMQFFSTLM